MKVALLVALPFLLAGCAGSQESAEDEFLKAYRASVAAVEVRVKNETFAADLSTREGQELRDEALRVLHAATTNERVDHDAASIERILTQSEYVHVTFAGADLPNVEGHGEADAAYILLSSALDADQAGKLLACTDGACSQHRSERDFRPLREQVEEQPRS